MQNTVMIMVDGVNPRPFFVKYAGARYETR